MNKNKTADARTLRTYHNSDRRSLVNSAKVSATVKRILRRMNRRTNKNICSIEAEQ